MRNSAFGLGYFGAMCTLTIRLNFVRER